MLIGFDAVATASEEVKNPQRDLPRGIIYSLLIATVLYVAAYAGVIILRRMSPGLERPFRIPWMPVIPVLTIASAAYLAVNLPAVTWIRFVVWPQHSEF